MNKLFLRAKLSEADSLSIFVKYKHLDFFSHLVSLDANIEPIDLINDIKYSTQIKNDKLIFTSEANKDKETYYKDEVDCSDFIESIIEQLDENENVEIIGRYTSLGVKSTIIYLKTLNTTETVIEDTEYIIRYDNNVDLLTNIFLYSNRDLKEKKIEYSAEDNEIKEVFNEQANMNEVQFDIENNKINKVLYRDEEFSERYIANRYIQHFTSVISSKLLTGDPIYEGSFVGKNSDETVHVFVSQGESLKSYSLLNKIYTVVKINSQNEFKNMTISDYYDMIEGELSISKDDIYMTINGMSFFSTLKENKESNIDLVGIDLILKEKFKNDNFLRYKEKPVSGQDFIDEIKMQISKQYKEEENKTEDVYAAAILQKGVTEQYISIADIYGAIIGVIIEQKLLS